DREAALPLNFSLDQLVFLRPGAVPVSVLNHPPLIRMEAHSIPPLDHRLARYSVPAHLVCKAGPYRLSVRMRSRTEPMYFMRQVKSTPAMIRRMLDHTLDLHPSSHTFWVR
ncbi:MAG: cytochrome C, partial [Planctomycetota bacterium]